MAVTWYVLVEGYEFNKSDNFDLFLLYPLTNPALHILYKLFRITRPHQSATLEVLQISLLLEEKVAQSAR